MKRLTREEKFMRAAVKAAKKGLGEGEVPIGAVVVFEDKVVAKGYNRRAKLQLASAHAEMMAIDRACKKFHSWRLPEGCELYVTLEPCPMCAGAIINARIPRVVCGVKDEKCGACGSVCNLFAMDFNHHPQIEYGLMEQECTQILKDFFQNLRLQLRTRPKWKKA